MTTVIIMIFCKKTLKRWIKNYNDKTIGFTIDGVDNIPIRGFQNYTCEEKRQHLVAYNEMWFKFL